MTMFGDANNDALFAGTGDQELRGGDGDDQLTAGPGSNALHGEGDNDILTWRVGNGAPTALDGGGGTNNILEVLGEGNADMLTASANSAALSIIANGAVFGATSIQNLTLDGNGGADVLTVNDLTGTGVKEVHVNQSQSIAPDNATDSVTVDARGGTNILINEAIGTVKEKSRRERQRHLASGERAQALLNGLAYKVYVANPEARLTGRQRRS